MARSPQFRGAVPEARTNFSWNPRVTFHAKSPETPAVVNVWTVKPTLFAFNTPGHERYGEEISTTASDASPPPLSIVGERTHHRFNVPSPIVNYADKATLTFGQIVSLGGDYYSRVDDDDDTYTGSAEGWENDTLLGATPDDIAQVLSFVDEHQRRPAAARAYEENVTRVVTQIATDAAPNKALWGERTVNASNYPEFREFDRARIRYLLLTLTNWDHFHPHCLGRYRALHKKAENLAREAGLVARERFRASKVNVAPDPWQDESILVKQQFRRALVYEAFAHHFLSDAFSAGHLIGDRYTEYRKIVDEGYWTLSRTARIIVPNVREVMVLEVKAGELALERHNGMEGKSGLDVRSVAHPDKYRIWGDENLFKFEKSNSSAEKVQWEQLELAGRLSLRLVYEAYVRALGLQILEDMSERKDPLEYVPHREDDKCCMDSRP